MVACTCSGFPSSNPYRRSTTIAFSRRVGPIYSQDRTRHLHILAASNSDIGDSMADKNDQVGDSSPAASVQDIRLFLTQRCIQSFMFLLSSTRDLHTVGWLDRFVQPITINNYWNEDVAYKPGAGDTFRENDKRYVDDRVIFLPIYSFSLSRAFVRAPFWRKP